MRRNKFEYKVRRWISRIWFCRRGVARTEHYLQVKSSQWSLRNNLANSEGSDNISPHTKGEGHEQSDGANNWSMESDHPKQPSEEWPWSMGVEEKTWVDDCDHQTATSTSSIWAPFSFCFLETVDRLGLWFVYRSCSRIVISNWYAPDRTKNACLSGLRPPALPDSIFRGRTFAVIHLSLEEPSYLWCWAALLFSLFRLPGIIVHPSLVDGLLIWRWLVIIPVLLDWSQRWVGIIDTLAGKIQRGQQRAIQGSQEAFSAPCIKYFTSKVLRRKWEEDGAHYQGFFLISYY